MNGNCPPELLSPTSKDKNRLYINGGGGNSSGFNSAGDGSTCSNGTTPPPLGRSTPNVSSVHGNHQGSTVATISNIDFESMNDSKLPSKICEYKTFRSYSNHMKLGLVIKEQN